MIDKVFSALAYLGVAVLIIFIHEIGHYIFGCFLGIPRNRMAIRIRKMTPHVAIINDNDEKISFVNMDEYIDILERYLTSDNKIFLYIIGGHTIELILLLTLATVSFFTKDSLAFYIANTAAWIAPLLAVNYLLTDIIITIRNKRPSGGDFSGSWAVSPFKAVLFYLFYFSGLVFAFVMMRGM